MVWLGETEGGIITQARVLDGNPDDAAYVLPSLNQHMQQFDSPTCWRVMASWRHRRMNTLQQRGVQHVVLPRPGKKTRNGSATNGNAGSDEGGTGGRG